MRLQVYGLQPINLNQPWEVVCHPKARRNPPNWTALHEQKRFCWNRHIDIKGLGKHRNTTVKLLSTCTYISTRRKYEHSSNRKCASFHSIGSENDRVSGRWLQWTKSSLGQESNFKRAMLSNVWLWFNVTDTNIMLWKRRGGRGRERGVVDFNSTVIKTLTLSYDLNYWWFWVYTDFLHDNLHSRLV